MKRRKMKRLINILKILFFFTFLILFIKAFQKSTGLDKRSVSVFEERYESISQNEYWPISKEEQRAKDENEEGSYTIRYQNQVSSQEIPMEDFLIGALAANIDMGSETETLKAQAVLLRGNCILKLQQTTTIDITELEISYMTLEQMQAVWGDEFQDNYRKVRKAVTDTKGIIARSGDTILKGNYHAMSAGRTRSGEEVLRDNRYQYLQSVPCDKNVENKDFLQKKQYNKTAVQQLEVVSRDSTGYVTKAVLNGKELGGEEVRRTLQLASANFETAEDKSGYTVMTKGIGHGFGFDQCYANYLARTAKADYMELISYFFQNISFTTCGFSCINLQT